jgi:SAM-dependent methyltransferase
MDLAAEYRQQFNWRTWDLVLDELPFARGQTVLDLGCGIGDQARLFASRGCSVIGLDGNTELIRAAIAAQLPNCRFVPCDLRRPAGLGIVADGIWCSFTAAYMTDLAEFLRVWAPFLRVGGWVAITEIDDMFGHEPIRSRTRELFRSFAADALAAGRYDFHMGSKLEDSLVRSGFAVSRVLTIPDQELSFQGAATPGVIDAWRRRFERMPGLRALCGSEFADLQQDFLSCLALPEHVSAARVIACIATWLG